MLSQTIFFYLIVIAVSYGTTSLLYCLVIFNNAALVIKNFTSVSWHDQMYETDPDIGNTLYNVVTAIPTFGAIVGAFAGNSVADKLGRKRGLLVTSIINCFGTVIASLSTPVNVFELMIVGRFIQGIAMGLAFSLGALFITEISPTTRRSTSLPLLELSITTISLLAVVLGSKGILGSLPYIWLLQGIQVIPSILTLMWLPFCPETPSYLYLSQDNRQMTIQSILFYQGQDYLDVTLTELETERQYFLGQKSFTWLELANSQYRKLFGIAILVTVGQAASGAAILNPFSTILLLDSGLNATVAERSTNIAFIVCILAAIFWIFVVHRTGRKPVFLVSMFGTFVFVLLFCVFNFYAFSTTWAPAACQWSIILTMIPLYGSDMVHWFIVEEMFDQKSRSKAVAATMTLNWTVQALSTLLTLMTIDRFGPGYALLPVALVALVTGILAAQLLPETKNRTFLQVMLKVTGQDVDSDERSPLLVSS